MLVVQDPHLHIPLFGLAQHHVHVVPPALLAKAVVRARFHAEGARAAVVNLLNQSGQLVVVAVVHPEEGQQVIALVAAENVFKSLIHDMTSHCFLQRCKEFEKIDANSKASEIHRT
ncbi:MAG: hypothetical protein IJ048_06620 [Clostridia bacterium]|nr:hypothetical protein [Clostridia bacterium]